MKHSAMAVAIIEADEAVALSVFVQIMGTSAGYIPQKTAGRGHFGHFWSFRLV